MRILPIAIVGAFIGGCSIAIANEDYVAPVPVSGNEKTISERQNHSNSNDEVRDIDTVVTGATVTSEHLAEWEAQRKLYLQCPECVANQPYPGD